MTAAKTYTLTLTAEDHEELATALDNRLHLDYDDFYDAYNADEQISWAKEIAAILRVDEQLDLGLSSRQHERGVTAADLLAEVGNCNHCGVCIYCRAEGEEVANA